MAGDVVRSGTLAEIAGPTDTVTVVVSPEDAPRAAVALNKWTTRALQDPGHFTVSTSDVRAVAQALHVADVPPLSVAAQQQGLEELFLRLARHEGAPGAASR